jgi:hypothetical protein
MPLNPPPTIETGLGLVVQGLKRSDQSRTAELTFSLNVAGIPDASVAQDAIDDFQTAFTAALALYLDTDVTIEKPSIKLGDGSTTPFEAIGAAAVSAGGDATAKVPPNVAVLVQKRTGLGGRKNHGRSYWPFLAGVAQVSENGTIDPVTVAALDVQMEAFLGQLNTDGNPMVISHKTYNVPLPPHYVTAITTGPLVTSYTTESLVATQRRRLGR